jgi:uncharacterized protein Yka (UPF0111/DUF47 family)
MMFKKEKEVIGDMIEHINAVEACAKTALRAIDIYIEGDTTESKALSRKVNDIETQADFIRYGIWDKRWPTPQKPAATSFWLSE